MITNSIKIGESILTKHKRSRSKFRSSCMIDPNDLKVQRQPITNERNSSIVSSTHYVTKRDKTPEYMPKNVEIKISKELEKEINKN